MRNAVLFAVLAGISASIAALFASVEMPETSMTFAAASAVMIIICTVSISGSILSVGFFFAFGNFMYGLSGPFAVLYGDGLPRSFARPYHVDLYLTYYALSNIGFSIALLILACGRNIRPAVPARPPHAHLLYITSLLIGTLATIFMLINTLRAGGFELIFFGKAAYQSGMMDMAGTLPANPFLFGSCALLGLSYAYKKLIRSQYVLFLAINSPTILVMLILGQRMNLANILICFFICALYYRPIKSIPAKYLVLGAMSYALIASTFAVRGYVTEAYLTGDISVLIRGPSEADRFASALNPTESEFQAAFGNFNTHIVRQDFEEWRLGESYIINFPIPIPRILWPSKPQPITYEFRDTYFPTAALRGSVAGTAFSSMLEAYLNFGALGIPIMQAVFTFLFLSLDVFRYRFPVKWYPIFYTLLASSAFSFYRSAFGFPFFNPGIVAIASLLIYSTLSRVHRARLRNRSPNLSRRSMRRHNIKIPDIPAQSEHRPVT